MFINNELYQMKVDVGMLNIVKIYWADGSSVSPCVGANIFALAKLTLETPAQ